MSGSPAKNDGQGGHSSLNGHSSHSSHSSRNSDRRPSRRGSQEFSPTRNTALSSNLATMPSAAAVQRALSAQRPVALSPGVDGMLDAPRNGPLRSPPPQPLPPTKGSTAATPSLPPKRQASAPAVPVAAPAASAATNSTLETVAESADQLSDVSTSQELDDASLTASAPTPTTSTTTTQKDGDSTGRPHPTLAKRSLTSLSAKPKPPDPPRTMTVETEPVTSVPPLLVGDRGASGRDGNGCIRTKGSNETIRPKKEKKKSTRKATSLHSGPPSSKADLFEAKVASAVEEADTSDSDETFVYESNPADNRTQRHHSRTPSANSLAGQDQSGRNRHGFRSGSHAIGGKKSMKFSSSAYAYSSHADDDKAESSNHQDSGRRTSQRHHHIGRYGKPAAHASILDPNSPFTHGNTSKPGSPRNLTTGGGGISSQANSSLSGNGNGNAGGRASRPHSPRVASNGRLVQGVRINSKPDSFDMYDDVADDERTPLVGSVRVNRSRHSRRPHSSGLRSTADYFLDDEEGEEPAGCWQCWSRWAGCLAVVLVVLIIGTVGTAFVLGLSQPLLNVRVRHLQNILASEQELMLDLHVDAVNANLFVITVSELDVNLFAESAYVGSSSSSSSSSSSRSHHHSDSLLGFPWDDPDEPEGPPTQKMLLGRILEFDSPLTFEPSPIGREMSSSVGEIRLPQPGNRTEVGGSERWERVLKHPFDLIVRGVLRYQLPLSAKTRSVKIASRARICPGDSDNDDGDNSTSPGTSASPATGTTLTMT